MKNELITVIMTSCKAYEDVLEIHELLMERHWPDCSFERILVMDEVTPEAKYLNGFDRVIVTGKETGRKNHLRISMALEKVKTPYVIFVQEDMLLTEKVDERKLLCLVDKLDKYQAGTIRLVPHFGVEAKFSNELEKDIVEYGPNTPYRISYAPSIWKCDYLKKISDRYIYGADFERMGTEYSRELSEKTLGCKNAVYPYMNGIFRGKWDIPTVKFLSYYGIIPDFSKHALMNEKDLFKQAFIGYIYSRNPKLISLILNNFNVGKKN